ncbi:MAG TPA: hypothetical protein PLR28_09380 [Dokdonella sp.]|nr:hypothetical protein [Dokdonella sp.]
MPTPLLLAWSGGKDSLMALDRSPADPEWAARGLLATLDRTGDRVAMHDVRGDLLREQVDALGFPLIEMAIESSASNVAYESALGSALDEARTRIPGLDHIAFVDLFLAELRAWREASLDRIGWNTVFPLWHTPTRELADAFIAPGHRALVTTVDLEQLDGGHCGREFDASFLADLPASIDPCGESGEFHTFCHNSPLFDRPLVLERREMTTRTGRFHYIDLHCADQAPELPGRSLHPCRNTQRISDHCNHPTRATMSKHIASTSRCTLHRALSICSLLAGLAISGRCVAHAPIEHYEGTAFDPAGRALYTESHWNRGSADDNTRVILFKCPDGKAFARKHVEDAGEAQAPLFELDDHRSGYREGVRKAANGKREVFVRRSRDQPEQTALIASKPGLVIDAGFDRFIVRHWDELVAGGKQRVEFLLPSRMRTYSFVLNPLGADSIDGVPVQRFRLELDAWFRFVVPSIDVAYASDTKFIREYAGVSNIRDNRGRNLRVRIDFPPASRSSNASAQDLAAAETIRLGGDCML